MWQGFIVQGTIATALASASGIVAGGVWLGMKLTLDPDGLNWLSERLPDWTQIALEDPNGPQTLDEIRSSLRASEAIPAEPVELSNSPGRSEILLPVLEERPTPCEPQCRKIVELRVYRKLDGANDTSESATYYLVKQLSVSGPAESFVIAPLVDANASAPGSTRSLPLTHLQRLTENVPQDGLWFNLIGERSEGDTPLTYGQIFRYNRDRSHLSLMLQWSSPAGQFPHWQELTGGGIAELVVDRTVGLEPDFAAYRLQPHNFFLNPVRLEPISISEPALDSRTYKNALLLARSGLWSPARTILESIRQESGTQWTADAQAQLDTIAFHADVTRTQAEASWANPSQKVLAALLDGRWTQGLETLEGHFDRAPEIVQMLSADTNRLWRRIDAALRVRPTDEDAVVWGVLVLALQQDTPAAVLWLQERENVSLDTLDRCAQLLERLGLGTWTIRTEEPENEYWEEDWNTEDWNTENWQDF